MSRTIHESLTDMKFTIDVDNRDLVAGAVVLLHLIDTETGGESIIVAASEGMGDFTQTGIVYTAHQIINGIERDD